jgi:peroxiredoxin
MKKAALLFLFSLFFCLLTVAQKQTLKVGDFAPVFSAADQDGNFVNLKEKLLKSKVILVFYRGHWCPYCNRELKALQDSLKLLQSKKAKVIAISPELPAYVQKTIEKTDATFPILSDRGHAIMDAYGVSIAQDEASQNRLKNIGVDLQVVNGANGNVLPVPAVFIINQDGKIDYIFFDPNYRARPSVKQLLEHL